MQTENHYVAVHPVHAVDGTEDDREQRLLAHEEYYDGPCTPELLRALRIKPRWSCICVVLSAVTFGMYGLAAFDMLLREEVVFLTDDKNGINAIKASVQAGKEDTLIPITTSEEVVKRLNLALVSQGASFLTAICVLSLWKCCSRIPVTWSMLCYYVLRGATVGAIVAIYLESWGLSIKLGGSPLAKSNVLFVMCSMFVVGLAEETAKIIAMSFNLARQFEELEPPDGCCQKCKLFRVLVDNPKTLMIIGVATGYGFMITENFEYFFSNAVQPDTYGKYDDPHAMALFGDFSRIYTAVTRNVLNPHPLFTGLAAGYMCDFYYGADAIPVSGTLSHIEWAKILGISTALHGSFDFFALTSGSWATTTTNYILMTMGLQLTYFFVTLILIIRQWRRIRLSCQDGY
eukprot:GEMP01041783.1.p1 GENE.GEMP01041783.1~~GEMP01041783.1.p1  ORF type:complete len:403 (+),score=73.04 GEMP01041783.1:66-1274(+)